MTGRLRAAAASGNDLPAQAVGGFLWSAVSFGTSRLVVFGVTLILARLLTFTDFGAVAAGLAIIAFFEISLDLGVGAAIVYEQESAVTDRVRTAFTLNLLIAGCLTLAGVLAAPALAAFLHLPGATALFQVLFGYLLLRGAGQVQDAVLQRDLRYRARTVVDVTRVLVRGAVSVVLAVQGAGAWALVYGLIAGEVAAVAVVSCYVRVLPAWRLNHAVAGALLRFGLPVLGVKTLNALSVNADNLIVGARLGPHPLGVYAIAYRLPDLCVNSVYWIFAHVSYPVYAKARTHGPDVLRAGMLRALGLVTLFGFPIGAGLAIVAPTAVPLLLSGKWEPAVVPVMLLSLASGLASIGYASGDIFPAIGRPATLLRLTTVSVAVLVAGFWFAAPYGIAAVAAVHLAFQLMYGVARLHIANRLVGSTWRESLTAMRAGLTATLGVTATALPVSLLAPAGWLGLAGTIAAGGCGAAGSLLLTSRHTITEVADLVRKGLR